MTLLFTLAQCNGTLDRLAHHAVRPCRGNRGAIPIMFFVLAAILASLGPGNIATAAILAPMAMATAVRAGIPLFLMAIMVGNGSNAGSLSPFAPTGIIVNGLMARIGMAGFEMPTYLYNLGAHAIVAFGGYFLLGGLKLFARSSTVEAVEMDPTPAADITFRTRHWITLAVIAVLILSVLFFEVNVGMGAFMASVVLVLLRAADDGEAVKRMPWRVIVMVCGVTVLIALLEKAQGIDLLVSLVTKVANGKTVTAVVAFLTGIISVYSSTSGVVLPAFLPMVPGLATATGRGSGRDRLIDERRWPPCRRLAALDHRRLVSRRRANRGCARALQQAAGVGPLDVVSSARCFVIWCFDAPGLHCWKVSSLKSQV